MDTRVLQRRRAKAAIFATACIALVFLSTSCGGGGSTAAVPVSTAGFQVSSTTVTFGNVPVNTPSAPLSATLTNNGTAALTISSILVSGPNAGDFVLTNTCGSSLAPSAQCTLSVTFTPSAAGSETASVVFTDNAAGSPQTVSLSGTGGNPQPSLTSLSPSSATVGAAAQTLTLTGTNFLSTSTVTYNGAGHAATFVSSTQLTISLSVADQATAGTYAVVVTNPAPGGGASNPVNFTVTANNPVPSITSLSPTSATPGSAAQTLTINGSNFISTSTVTYNGVGHTATFVNSGQVTILLSASDQATAGTYAVVVTNPAPGGGASNSVNFAVTANNPVPSITSLSPASATAGAAAQTLTINGTNFLTTSTVTYNGAAHTPTFVGSTQLTITLSTSDQATAGTYAVVVTNPAPGGGASNSVNFTVNNLVPSITSLSPTSATAGAAAQTLTINGTNFVSTSTVTYNGVSHTATFVNAGQLTIALSSGDQATAGTYAVVVTNPAPGGGASNSVNFTVNNLVPSITSLSPTSATAGAAAQALTINGTNFLTTSTVTYNGAAHTPTFVSSTQLTITLSASDQATAGTYAVVVTNPAPGGGASNSVNFTVNNLVPSITSLSPTSANAGAAAQTLTIKGTNFLTTSTVTYNGAAHTPTFVSSTQLTITLSASDQATAGTYAVVVTNPSPGGGASNSVNFTVTANNPVPSITSLSPTSSNAGAAAQTLTINGTNFLTTSTVTYNGAAHTATFVSSTQLTITLSAGDQATAGTYAVVVTNPAPGGGASNSVNFTVTAPIAGLSPTSFNFGSLYATTSSSPENFTLNNTGNATLSITSIGFTGTNPGDFSQNTTCGTTLAASTTCTIAVVFTPAASGSRSGTLVVTDNSNNVPGSTQSATLTGTGLHDVVLTWTASPTSGILGYDVYRGTTSGGESTTPIATEVAAACTTLAPCMYVDTAVVAGTTYYYYVTAVASNGTTQSSDSNEASATVPTP